MATYYVATTGSSSNPGTLASPWSIQYGFSHIGAGDTLYLRGGDYHTTGGSGTVTHFYISDLVGTSSSPILISNYPGEVVNIDMAGFYSTNWYGYCVNFDNNTYVTLRGLRVINYLSNSVSNTLWAFLVSNSSNCTIENCWANNIGGYGWANNDSSNMLYKNCDASRCADPYGAGGTWENANGFGITSNDTYTNTSTNVTYDGCRAWFCSDDGFDLFGADGFVTFNNCWAFYNGYDENLNSQGNGQGFKLGPNKTSANNNTYRRLITNCIAAGNKTHGFDKNHGEMSGGCVMYFYNNLAYDNVAWGYAFTYSDNTADLFKNNIGYGNGSGNELLSSASQAIDANNSWNGFTVSDADFVSLVISALAGARQANGNLPALTFGHLAAGSDLIGAGINVSLALDGDGKAFTNPPSIGPYEYGTVSIIPVTTVTVTGMGGAIIIDVDKGALQMSAHIDPHDATDKSVVWSVVNETGVGSIDQNGLLAAVANGTVTVKARSNG
jgi:hypothetical protein